MSIPDRLILKELKHPGLRALKQAFRVKGMSRLAREVLAAIATFSNSRGYTWASEKTLGEAASISTRSVRTGIRELEALGIVKVSTRGWKEPHGYQINSKVLDAMPTIWGPVGPADVDEVIDVEGP